ncbi:hypothetical protein ACRN9F_09755 [Shewanella oncorhynchi]|uniref:hypothetical protein n=1 Tax=Shewanella oncorhynchi TaxID=2726434 RepID=UPI003D7A5CD0
MTEQDVIFWAILGGGIGGLASFMLIAYNKFEKIPTKEEAEIAKNSLRKTYLILRVTFGIISAFICSFWFMDSALDGTISQSKLTFYSAIIGFSTSLLPAISEVFVKIYAKVIGKING